MQLTFEGKTIDQLAIELIQAYEPPEGYYLGFSGGKDSVVIYDLAKRSGVKFSAHYSVSPIDPPQIHSFIKEQYPDVIWEYNAKNFWNVHVMRNGLPLRTQRWCCRLIKESGGDGWVKILGMRRAESNKRSKYKCFQENKGQRHLLPVVYWSDLDVWQYISERQLKVCSLYTEGFTRIGCILCPYCGKDETRLQIIKFPKIANLWLQAAKRYTNKRMIKTKGGWKHKTGEEYFNWWINRK
jgi:phosphoadenosine phosphosulfate reductase